jgi:integrase
MTHSTDLQGFREWLDDHPRGYALRTRQGYLKALHAVRTLEDPVLLLMSPVHSKGYKSLVKAALKLWAEYTDDPELAKALTQRRVTRNIASSLRGQQTRGPLPEIEYRRFLTQLHKLQSTDPRWMWAGVSLACKLALRVGSDLCTGIQRHSCELAFGGTRIQVVGKGDKVRELPASGVQLEIASLLRYKGWNRVEDIVAPDAEPETRYRVAYSAFRKVISVVARSAGLHPEEVNTHRLRKSSAYLLYKRLDHDIDAVRRILGHAHTSTTQDYLGIDNLDEIGEAMRDIFR